MARVLIIKLSALGDVILAGAAIRRLLLLHNNDQVELLTAAPFADLFKGQKNLLIHNYKHNGYWRLLQTAYRLRPLHYQRVYDLQGNKHSRLLTALTGAAERFGLWPGWPYNHATAIKRRTKSHPLQRFNALLEDISCPPLPPGPILVPAAHERQTVHDWLNQQQLLQQRLVLIHAGASRRWPSKRWPEHHFLQTAQTLQSRGFSIIWIGGPDDMELNQNLTELCGTNACNLFSIPRLMALASYADFALTNDSGPMHALAAADLPVYSFFGPTGWQFSHAINQADRVFSSTASCSPCYSTQCPLTENRHHCLIDIRPDQVLKRLADDGHLI